MWISTSATGTTRTPPDILVRQGKALYWGTSEWDVFHLTQAISFARDNGLIPPAVEQPVYHLMARPRVENDLAPLCQELGLGLTTYSPLFHGILSGKYNSGLSEGSRASLEGAGCDRIAEPLTVKSRDRYCWAPPRVAIARRCGIRRSPA